MLSQRQKLQALVELSRNNLIVRACINRISSAVLPQRVHITERTGVLAQFKALKPELAEFMSLHFAKFLHAALESMLVLRMDKGITGRGIEIFTFCMSISNVCA